MKIPSYRSMADAAGRFGVRLFSVKKENRRLFQIWATIIGIMLFALAVRYLEQGLWLISLLALISLDRFCLRRSRLVCRLLRRRVRLVCRGCGHLRRHEDEDLCPYCTEKLKPITSIHLGVSGIAQTAIDLKSSGPNP